MTTSPRVVSTNSAFSGSVFGGNAELCFEGDTGKSFRVLRRDGGLLDIVQIGECARQIGIPFRLDAALIGAAPLRCALAVSVIERVHDFHARHDLAEWRKALTVEIAVIAEVDENLGRARVRAGGGEGYEG